MKFFIILITLLLFISACGKQPVPVEPPPTQDRSTAISLSPEKQQEMALEIFNEILNITQNTTKKRAFPEIEKRYTSIINTYPQARIARESYIRLMQLYITNKSPENINKANKLLQRFAAAYSGDPMEEKIRTKINKADQK